MPAWARHGCRETFANALDAQVREDRSILAAILCGSLAYGENVATFDRALLKERGFVAVGR